jgi:hypothetical protein
MKTSITICFLFLTTVSLQAQEALRKYTAEMSGIETLTDDTQKSDGRGKALAAFFDSRTAEADKQTAINETVPYLRQLVDYDFYGAYNFLMKVKNLDDAQLFMKNHLSKEERALVRAFASNTVNNWQSGGQYPAKAPKKGYGLKGKWNTGTGASDNSAIAQNTTPIAKTALQELKAQQPQNSTVLGLQPFKSDNGKWGFKDQNGKVIVAPKYNRFHQFREGLAAVSIGGSYDEEFDMVLGSKYGFIDNTGKEVIALKYESINDGFYEGLAAVKLNGKWGYINMAGNEVIPFQYSEAFIFMKGKAKVRKDGREFFIDKTGKEAK